MINILREGDFDIVKYLLKLNVHFNLNARTRNGRTPFHIASLHGHLEVLILLLNESVDQAEKILSSKDSCGINPLMDALLADHVHIVEYIYKKYAFADRLICDKDLLDNSCIHLVAQSGSLNCCEYLFDRYFNQGKSLDFHCFICYFKNDLNKFLMTSLHSACKVILIF